MDEILNIGVFIDDEDDDDLDDAMILHILNDHENIGNRVLIYGRFNFEAMLDLECKNLFRFHKVDIRRLTRALNIPNNIEIFNVTTISGE